MAHPQNSPRGSFSKQVVQVGAQTLTGSATGLKVSGGLALSGQANKYLTQDSTGALVIPTFSDLPAYRKPGGFCLVSNSTGKMLAYHSTGTTWLYANITSVLA